jgi:hypothetical protein
VPRRSLSHSHHNMQASRWLLQWWNRHVTSAALLAVLEERCDGKSLVAVRSFNIAPLDPYYFNRTALQPDDQLLVTATITGWYKNVRTLRDLERRFAECLVYCLSDGTVTVTSAARNPRKYTSPTSTSTISPLNQFTCRVQCALIQNKASPEIGPKAVAHWETSQGRHMRSTTKKLFLRVTS